MSNKIDGRSWCDIADGVSMMVKGMIVLSVLLYRATPRRVRCHREGLSCSAYMLQSLRENGLLKGLGMGFTYWSECTPKASNCGAWTKMGNSWGDQPMPNWKCK